MINGRTYYDILDLPKYGINDAGEKISYSSIERAKNRLIYGNSNGEDRISSSEMSQIKEAIRVLSNPETRKQYDMMIEDIINNKKESPVVEKPVVETPVVEKPIVETPVVEKPVVETPVVEKPVVKTPVVEKPIVETPVVEKPVVETPVVEAPDRMSPVEQDHMDIKKLKESQLKVYTKIKRDFKLVPKYEERTIDGLITEETKLIEKYEENLITQIYELLSKPLTDYNNYNIQIAKLKYENQIKLLEERIKFKEQQKIQKGEYISYWFTLLSLKRSLKTSKKRLSNLFEYMDRNAKTQKDNSKFNNIYRELKHKEIQLLKQDRNLKEIDKKIEQEKIKKDKKQSNIFKVKNLEIKSSKILSKKEKMQEQQNQLFLKRDKKANKMVLNRNGIVRGVQFIVAFDIVKTKIGNFTDKIMDKLQTEENTVKTR